MSPSNLLGNGAEMPFMHRCHAVSGSDVKVIMQFRKKPKGQTKLIFSFLFEFDSADFLK